MSTSNTNQEHVLYQGKFFTIISSTATLPNGKKMVTEHCLRPPSVIVIPLVNQNHVVMTVEHRVERGGVVWGMVAGQVEKREQHQPETAARRELREETGYRAKRMRLVWVSEPSSSVRWKRYVYLATGLTPAAEKFRRDGDEDIKIKIISLDEAGALALQGKIPNETAALALLRLKNDVTRLREKAEKEEPPPERGRGSSAKPSKG